MQHMHNQSHRRYRMLHSLEAAKLLLESQAEVESLHVPLPHPALDFRF